MMKIKFQIISRFITFLLFTCIAMNISAQKNESWTTFDLDEISISAPKHLENIMLNQKNRAKGFIRHYIGTEKMIGERGKELFSIQINRFPNYSIEEEFAGTKRFYKKEFENAKIKKCKPKTPCDLHYTASYESVNPFSGKREYGEAYTWLYKQGESIFYLNISFSDTRIINKKELLKTIHKVQSTFIIH